MFEELPTSMARKGSCKLAVRNELSIAGRLVWQNIWVVASTTTPILGVANGISNPEATDGELAVSPAHQRERARRPASPYRSMIQVGHQWVTCSGRQG